MFRYLAGYCLALACLASPSADWAQAERGPRQPVPVVPASTGLDGVLGRVSANGVTLSLLCHERAMSLLIRYGNGKLPAGGLEKRCEKGAPTEIRLDGLVADREYRYEVSEPKGAGRLLSGRFHTARPAGASFVFTLTSDSHLDDNTDAALYQRTLANALADAPDFHFDLGDTFMTGKHEQREHAQRQYLAQRIYLARLGESVPLFMVLGNHDGEERRLRREGADSLAVWANGQRKRYFPNPQPDGFFSGNSVADADAGLLQDYYAFTWGDALFVALNPYWHGHGRRGDAPWELSLGTTQYQWLKSTLAGSRARFKFIFVHQLVGGFGRQGRGGVEAIDQGEWGGRNGDGREGFHEQRPDWEMPIHPLLLRYGVTAVFHGHDHLFARQARDGIVYQAMPQPGHPGEGVPRFAAEYGYREGVILGGAGHLRVSVRPTEVVVDFVRASLSDKNNGRIANHDVIAARSAP